MNGLVTRPVPKPPTSPLPATSTPAGTHWPGRVRTAATAALVLMLLVPLSLPPADASGPDNTSPRPRASLLPQVAPAWMSLTDGERAVLSPFESQWSTWSVDERRAWVVVARRFPKLSAQQREAMSVRIREWAVLTPQQRRMARQNYRLARSLPKAERAEEVRRYQDLTPDQKQVLEDNGTLSNTAARHAGARTGLAKQAAQPLADLAPRPGPRTTRPATPVSHASPHATKPAALPATLPESSGPQAAGPGSARP